MYISISLSVGIRILKESRRKKKLRNKTTKKKSKYLFGLELLEILENIKVSENVKRSS